MVTYVRNGVECQSKASKYYDSLTVEGFGNTDPQWASSHNGPIPQSVTINLNERVAISRIRKWPRKEAEITLYGQTKDN